jgi:hypothetical protein
MIKTLNIAGKKVKVATNALLQRKYKLNTDGRDLFTDYSLITAQIALGIEGALEEVEPDVIAMLADADTTGIYMDIIYTLAVLGNDPKAKKGFDEFWGGFDYLPIEDEVLYGEVLELMASVYPNSYLKEASEALKEIDKEVEEAKAEEAKED